MLGNANLSTGVGQSARPKASCGVPRRLFGACKNAFRMAGAGFQACERRDPISLVGPLVVRFCRRVWGEMHLCMLGLTPSGGIFGFPTKRTLNDRHIGKRMF